MPKTAKPTNLLNKNSIVRLLAIVSFIAVTILWIYTIAFTHYVDERSVTNEEQIGHLMLQNAQLQYCIDNAVKPCTQEAISAQAEASDTK